MEWKQYSETITFKLETRFDYPGPYSRRKTLRLLRDARNFKRTIKNMNQVSEYWKKLMLECAHTYYFTETK